MSESEYDFTNSGEGSENVSGGYEYTNVPFTSSLSDEKSAIFPMSRMNEFENSGVPNGFFEKFSLVFARKVS